MALTVTAASFRARRARCRALTKDWLRRAPTAAMHGACPTGLTALGAPLGGALPPLVRCQSRAAVGELSLQVRL